jgi:hypothetical protein
MCDVVHHGRQWVSLKAWQREAFVRAEVVHFSFSLFYRLFYFCLCVFLFVFPATHSITRIQLLFC